MNKKSHILFLKLIAISLLSISQWQCKPPASKISSSSDASSEVETLPQFAQDIAETKVHIDMIIKNKMEDPSLELNFQSPELVIIQSIIEKTKDKHARFYAIKSYLRLLNDLKLVELKSEADRLSKLYLSECSDFIDCIEILSTFSDLLDYYPNIFIVDGGKKTDLYLKIQSNIENLPHSLAKGLLLYKLDSLYNFSFFVFESEIFNDSAKGLPSSFAFKDYLMEKLSHENKMWNESFSSLTWETMADIIAFNVKEIDKSHESWEAIKYFSNFFLEGVKKLYIGNLSLNLYLERMNEKDPKIWLDNLIERVKLSIHGENNGVDPTLAFITLSRFLRKEMTLPNRFDWIATIEKIIELTPDKMADFDTESTIKFARELAQATNTQIYHNMTLLGLTINKDDFNPEENKSLFEFEKMLAKEVSGFYSLYHQGVESESEQLRLASAAMEAKEKSDGFLGIGDEQEDYWENVVIPHFNNANNRWLGLQCLQKIIGKKYHGYDKNIDADQKVSIYDDETYNLKEICPNTGDFNADLKSVFKNVSQFLSNKRISEVKKSRNIAIAIEVGLIPLTILSAGTAAVVTKPIQMAVTSGLRKVYLNMIRSQIQNRLLKKLTLVTFRKLIPHLLGSVAGSIAFTATQSIVLSIFGQKKLYDTKKSFWDNYGKSLLTGSLLFFCLPGVHSSTGFLGIKLFTNNIKFLQDKVREKFFLQGLGHVAGQQTFAHLPYLHRAFEKYVEGKNTPIWQGWKDYYHNQLDGALYEMTFAAYQAKFN